MTATPDPAAGADAERHPEQPVCVTHHLGCDCREWRINELVRDLQEQLRQAKADLLGKSGEIERLKMHRDHAWQMRELSKRRAERWKEAARVYRMYVIWSEIQHRAPRAHTMRIIRMIRRTTHQAPDGAG